MGILDNIGNFRVGGSIDAQFRTGNALERIMIASGQQVGGFTSFLTTLELFGYLLLMFTGIFIICAFAIIYILIFVARVWGYLFPSKAQKKAYAKAKANGEFMSDKELEQRLNRFELTKEEEEEIKNMH